MYPIIKIPTDISSQLEQLGTKAKFWYWNKQGHQVLFKEGRPGTGENWAEKVCCEIARKLGLPHAEYELAKWRDRNGIISPNFVPKNTRLIHGNEILARVHTDYDETRTYRTSQHTLKIVIKVIQQMTEKIDMQAPMEWDIPSGINDCLDVFTGYLMLDALVANQDRHHENWGVINSFEHGFRLAPAFDQASSLGRNESDKNRTERLTSKDIGRGVAHYCNRARSGFYRSNADKKPMRTFDAFAEIAKISTCGSRYWLEQLNNFTMDDFEHILRQIPATEISEPATLFALKMLESNKHRLLTRNTQ